MKRLSGSKLGGLMLILTSSTVLADPVLSIQPAQLIQPVSRTFQLDINIQGAVNVYAFQFDLIFGPDILTFTGITEGPFLASGGGSTFWVPGRIGNGTVNAVADTLLGLIPGVSGNGTLATVDFTSTRDGTTSVALSNVLLLDSSLHEIASSSIPAAITILPEPTSGALAGFALLGMLIAFRRKWRIRIPAGMLFLVVLAASVQAAAPGYKFTILPQSADINDYQIGINNNGTVVFSTRRGIFTPAGPVVMVGQTIGGITLTAVGSPVINDAGTIVFQGIYGNGEFGIFTPTQRLAARGDTIGGLTLTGDAVNPALNNAGTVVFGAEASPVGGLFTTSGLVVPDNAVIDGKTVSIGGPAVINDAGTIFFGSFLYDPSQPLGLGFGLFTPSQLLVATGDTVGGVTLSGLGIRAPAVNNAGSVVFLGSSSSSGKGGIFTLSELLVPDGTTIGGKTLTSVTDPAINEAGTIVFVGLYGTGNGIFTTSELVIGSGDTVDGKVLGSVTVPYINKAGIIVFSAGFSDGSAGVVMATPISSGVPGDANDDGVIDCADLTVIKASLGKAYGQAGFNPRADTNGDNLIDIRDLTFVAQQLSAGASCP